MELRWLACRVQSNRVGVLGVEGNWICIVEDGIHFGGASIDLLQGTTALCVGSIRHGAGSWICIIEEGIHFGGA